MFELTKRRIDKLEIDGCTYIGVVTIRFLVEEMKVLEVLHSKFLTILVGIL